MELKVASLTYGGGNQAGRRRWAMAVESGNSNGGVEVLGEMAGEDGGPVGYDGTWTC